MPFSRYVAKLKLHGAAMWIAQKGSLLNIGKEAGYANAQSFSKAFRKEFGMSPKQFLQSEEEISDMPIYRKINGEDVRIEYVTEPGSVIHGRLIEPVHGNDTDLSKEVGYYYDHICTDISEDDQEEKIEMWWHDDQCNIRCFIGKKAADDQDAPAGMLKIVMPSDYYVVFSVKYWKRNGDSTAISNIVKELDQFAFEEWKIINGKNLRYMGYTFIKYKEDKISIYVPVYKRNIVHEAKMPKFKGTNDWIQYVDEHLKDNLTVGQLAEAFNYSERHFTDTFEMYFGIRPGLYIKKRRLYHVAKELRCGEDDLEKLVKSYGFQSMAGFRKSFLEEFSCEPEQYDDEEYKVDNMLRC